ncbi:MAG: ATP-binding protein [Spirulinaceae cyanobacterium]
MAINSFNHQNTWYEANHQYLMRSIAQMRKIVEQRVKQLQNQVDSAPVKLVTKPPEFNLSPPPALEQLCQLFHLSPFERDVILLCVGMELDATWSWLCSAAQGEPQYNYPTFNLALAVSAHVSWRGLTPSTPLRSWHLVEIASGKSLTSSLIKIDERILHYLTGVQYLDQRLKDISLPLSPTDSLVPSHQRLVEQITKTWSQGSTRSNCLPVLQLCGEDIFTKQAIAATACAQMGMTLHSISVEALPTDHHQLSLIKRLCERESILTGCAWELEFDELVSLEPAKQASLERFIDNLHAPLMMTARDRRRQRKRPLITFDVFSPTTDEQRLLWANALGTKVSELNGQVDILVSNFNLSAPAIEAACLKAKGLQTPLTNGNSHSLYTSHLWNICRTQARPRLDELAERIELGASWEDLILPEKERDVLRDIEAHVRQRAKVYEQWGFGRKSKRGLGISAMFAGESGTGKTLAAEVLGNTLKLDVYRIDLSSVVSKYIGETEKNLRRLFDAAEGGGVILLFDEADALFGKRSEVKDSHDRHANIEVSYLLQRMEAYRGLAILTTNLKSSLDQAFMRRLRFVVDFPFPNASQRAAIWQRIFPQDTPTKNLNYQKLAKLSVPGGNIRSMALNAAFLAADAGEAVQMKHILQAAKNEYVKMERPFSDSEVKDWLNEETNYDNLF